MSAEATPDASEATGSFIESLQESDLYSMGAFFCDQHPELVDDREEGPGALGGGDQDAGGRGLPHAGHRPRGPLLQGTRRVSEPASRRRPRPIGVAVLIGIALIGIAVIASLSLDEGDTDPIEIDDAGEVRKLVGGIPQLEDRLGEDNAPVTVEVFNDLQCTGCSDWQLDVIEPLIEDEVRSGEVKLEFRHWSMTERPAGVAAYGAVAAGLQAQEWQFVELFFHNQAEATSRGVTQEFLDEVAKGVLNLNVEQWQNDFDESEVKETLEDDDLRAVEERIPTEPAVIVSGPGGIVKLIETPTLADVRGAIAEVSG
jgi:protein-disulfide isomerase